LNSIKERKKLIFNLKKIIKFVIKTTQQLYVVFFLKIFVKYIKSINDVFT